MWGSHGDDRPDLRKARVGAVVALGEGGAGDEPALGVGEDVDGDTGVLVLELLQEGAQAGGGRADVDLGVGLSVRIVGRRASSVAEAVDVVRRVAETSSVDVEDGRSAPGGRAARAQPADEDREVALVQARSSDVGGRAVAL